MTQALRVECGGLVTKMMNATGPRKLQRKPCSGFSQQLDEKGGVWLGAREDWGTEVVAPHLWPAPSPPVASQLPTH